jgi:hypothetical protein
MFVGILGQENLEALYWRSVIANAVVFGVWQDGRIDAGAHAS